MPPTRRATIGGGSGSPGRPGWPAAIALAVVFVLSRLPLLGGGFGADIDSWINAVGAIHMREVGRYIPTRIPGFPAYEALLVLLVPLGHRATNGASVLAQAAAIVFFWRLARRLVPARAAWATAAFAFGPPLWVDASQTMDYAFGLAAMLGACDALLAGRRATAGALLALATGFRPTLALLLLPVALSLRARRESPAGWLAFAGAYGAVAVALFVPVLLAAPPGEMAGEFAFHAARQHVTLATAPRVVRVALAFAFGKLGTIVIALGLLAGLRTGRAGAGDGASGGFSGLAWISILVMAAFYLVIPLDAAYLMPVVPLALLLLARRLPARWFAVAAIAIMSETLVTPLLDVRRLVPGRVVAEWALRREQLASSRALLALRPGAPTVYVVGRFQVHRMMLLDPSLERTDAAWAAFRYPTGVALWSPDRGRGYAAFLEPAQSDSLRAAGFTLEGSPTGVP